MADVYDEFLLTGQSNYKLAEEVAAFLGMPLMQATVGRFSLLHPIRVKIESILRFSDGEVSVQLKESVRNVHIFVIQVLRLVALCYRNRVHATSQLALQ